MIRLVLACVALILAAWPASASPDGVRMMKNWVAMDKCARLAQQAFPDYSAEAYAKRDARLRECLAGSNLPPREPLAPPPQ